MISNPTWQASEFLLKLSRNFSAAGRILCGSWLMPGPFWRQAVHSFTSGAAPSQQDGRRTPSLSVCKWSTATVPKTSPTSGKPLAGDGDDFRVTVIISPGTKAPPSPVTKSAGWKSSPPLSRMPSRYRAHVGTKVENGMTAPVTTAPVTMGAFLYPMPSALACATVAYGICCPSKDAGRVHTSV